MTNKVLEHIAAGYEAVREGVGTVMGGKALEYEAKTIKREGIKEGIKEVKSVMGGKVLEYEAKTIRNEGLEEGLEKGMEKGIRGTVSILKK